jgi:putative hydrolase of the HAD superfamily
VHVKAVFFDAVGTMLHPKPGAGEVYREVGRRYGVELSLGAARRRFDLAFRRQEDIDRAGAWVTSEQREYQRWRAIVGEVLMGVGDFESCFAELYDHFARPAAWQCAPAAETVLPDLARRGFMLGLASNYDHRLHAVVAGMAALRPIQHVVVSSEVGWRKPAREFFEALSRRTSLPPEEILLVGDDYENDYVGARAAELQALLYDPTQRGAAGSAPRIAAWDELLDLTRPM